MSQKFAITGTDTNVDKTVFAAGLAVALGARYWKPIQAGLANGSDSERVARLGVPRSLILPEAYQLTTPCSPHLAAELNGITIDPLQLAPPAWVTGPLVIEGADGVLVPITREVLYADVFANWNVSVIIVARTALGTINHSLLTIEALRTRNVEIHGIAFVGPPEDDSEQTICEIGSVRRLGRLDTLNNITATSLQDAFAKGFDLDQFR